MINVTESETINAPELIEKIGKRIYTLRKKKGLSREELAFRIGVCPQQLFKYEIGENRITVDRLILVALALDLKIISFFSVDDVGARIGLPALEDQKDYQVLEHLARLKNLSGEELAKRVIRLLSQD